MKACHQIEGRVTSTPGRSTEGNLETLLRKSITNLSKTQEERLVRFLFLVLDKLILLLVRPPVISGTIGMINKVSVRNVTVKLSLVNERERMFFKH